VDDEEMIIEVGSGLLQELGYTVIAAKSGQEALDIYRLRQAEIDLVIMDMIMPGMGGSETFDRLKQTNPNAKVLLSSGYSINGQASKIMARGCDGFIQKPFNINQLSNKLREILDKR
jgi:CheY-like chemotaxis protein